MLLCGAALLAFVIRADQPATVFDWIAFPIMIAIAFPFIAAPNLVMLAVVMWRKGPVIRAVALAVSGLFVADFAWVLATADLSGSSTAGVGLVFYPVYQLAYAVPAALVLVLADRWIKRPKQ